MKLSDLRKLSNTLALESKSPDPQLLNRELRALGYDPGSLYQELEMESRFVDTHRDTSYSNANVALHSHTFYELLYCRNTCGAEYLVGAERYRLQKGDVILIAPGVSHRPLLPENMPEPYQRDVLWISTDFMPFLLQNLPAPHQESLRSRSLLRTAGTQWEMIGQLFHNGVAEAESRAPGWELAVIGNTVTLLGCLYRASLNRTAVPMQAERPALLERVLQYIEENMAEKITLAEVARQFYISESTITQLFRKKMGVSFYRCVTQRRLIAAKSLIAQNVQLDSICHQVGFTDYSVFYKAFKKEYGISPRQYRDLLEK